MNQPKQFNRYHHNAILPIVVRRVLLGEFTSRAGIALAYGVHRDTIKTWRKEAIEAGLTTALKWKCGLMKGRINQIIDTPHDPHTLRAA